MLASAHRSSAHESTVLLVTVYTTLSLHLYGPGSTAHRHVKLPRILCEEGSVLTGAHAAHVLPVLPPDSSCEQLSAVTQHTPVHSISKNTALIFFS